VTVPGPPPSPAGTPRRPVAVPDPDEPREPDGLSRLIAELSDWLAPAGALVACLHGLDSRACQAIHIRHPERKLRFALYGHEPVALYRSAEYLREAGGKGTTFCWPLREGLAHEDAQLSLVLFAVSQLPASDRLRYLSDLLRRTRPGGSLLLAEHAAPSSPRWQGFPQRGVGPSGREATREALSDTTISTLVSEAGWQGAELLCRDSRLTVHGAFA